MIYGEEMMGSDEDEEGHHGDHHMMQDGEMHEGDSYGMEGNPDYGEVNLVLANKFDRDMKERDR
jgi:hypothetical protein